MVMRSPAWLLEPCVSTDDQDYLRPSVVGRGATAMDADYARGVCASDGRGLLDADQSVWRGLWRLEVRGGDRANRAGHFDAGWPCW
jgi:hypothetical protein